MYLLYPPSDWADKRRRGNVWPSGDKKAPGYQESPNMQIIYAAKGKRARHTSTEGARSHDTGIEMLRK